MYHVRRGRDPMSVLYCTYKRRRRRGTSSSTGSTSHVLVPAWDAGRIAGALAGCLCSEGRFALAATTELRRRLDGRATSRERAAGKSEGRAGVCWDEQLK